MIATETIVPNRKLKIKFSTKKIEVDIGTKCEFGQKMSHIEQSGHCNSKESSSVSYSHKRGPPGSVEGQRDKRQKMDRKLSQQCATILKSLTSHRYSWVFSKPVDPVALNIPDYFTIISEPMDLGTIKSKLEKNLYSAAEEFAADVRLTFSNAMKYNPPSNDVHLMAKELNKIFLKKWNDMEKKWKGEGDIGNMISAIKEPTTKSNGMVPLPQNFIPRKPALAEEKSVQKSSSLVSHGAKVGIPKSSHISLKLIRKDLQKGGNGGHPFGSTKACPSSALATHKCSVCGDISCHCVIPNNSTNTSSDLSSEGSEVRDMHVCLTEGVRLVQAKCASPLPGKSGHDSDGTRSAMDGDHRCSSSQLTTATDAASGEEWSSPVFDVQLSPKKALRAAMMKSRFADTILKAQQKTLLDHGDKADLVKLQHEKERMERIQREERAKIEAQIRAAEAAARMRSEEELKRQREREREAARVAIEKMERTIEIDHNLETLKELEMLSGCRLSYQFLRGKNGSRASMKAFDNPLERLGLFIKDEYVADDDDEFLNGVGREEGEIFS